MSSIASTQTDTIISDEILLKIIYEEHLLQYLYPLRCSREKTNKLQEIKKQIQEENVNIPSPHDLRLILNSTTEKLEKEREKILKETKHKKSRTFLKYILDGVIWLRDNYFDNMRVSLCKNIINIEISKLKEEMEDNFFNLISKYVLIGQTLFYIEKKYKKEEYY